MSSNNFFFSNTGIFSIGIFFLCSFFLQVPQVIGQEEQAIQQLENNQKISLNFGADLVSRYVWRGIDFGQSPAIQPSIAFKAYGFSVGAWGSYAFSRATYAVNDTFSLDYHYAEMDLFIAYTYKYFTLMLYDFFTVSPVDTALGNNYFDWNNDETNHTLEASFIFNGTEKFPLQFLASVLVYGADKGKDSTGTYGLGSDNNYSTYLELSYQFHVKGFGLRPYLGGIPFGSAWYGPEAGITAVGLNLSKEIPITKQYALPVQGNLVFNPLDKKAYLVFIITI